MTFWLTLLLVGWIAAPSAGHWRYVRLCFEVFGYFTFACVAFVSLVCVLANRAFSHPRYFDLADDARALVGGRVVEERE